MKEKVTKKVFCELAGCSHQLIDLYAGKGMPKHQHPENKRTKLFDLSECFEWAIENNFINFSRKIGDAIQRSWQNATKPEKEEEMIAPPSGPAFDTCIDEDEDLKHGEGSTAHPIQLKKNKILEIERHFNAISKLLDEIYQEVE